MALIALVVAVVLSTALAVAGFVFYQRLLHRINNIAQVSALRYMAPEDDGPLKNVFAAVPPTASDVVGVWAEEQERLGVRVSDEEMEIQRRMWAAEAS